MNTVNGIGAAVAASAIVRICARRCTMPFIVVCDEMSVHLRATCLQFGAIVRSTKNRMMIDLLPGISGGAAS